MNAIKIRLQYYLGDGVMFALTDEADAVKKGASLLQLEVVI